jgi:hypothetical protein
MCRHSSNVTNFPTTGSSMKAYRWFGAALVALALGAGASAPLAAQGVTGAAVEGIISQEGGAAVEGAQVEQLGAKYTF